MQILGVGGATIDIVNELESYPCEDREVRALAQRVARGGNAANTLVVLSQLGYRCSWAGAVANDPGSRRVLQELASCDIATRYCRRHPGGVLPTSYVSLSRATGSRTIVHYRDLPEFSSEDFSVIGLEHWDWVHFEGRAPEETRRMIDRLKTERPDLGCSLEVEKPRPGMRSLFEGPDVLLFSRTYAQHQGFADPRAFLGEMRYRSDARLLFCAWGEAGAAVADARGRLWESPADLPRQVVDTLGAGDVFNAAVIDGVLQQQAAQDILAGACLLAGRKCGQQGFAGLGRVAPPGDD